MAKLNKYNTKRDFDKTLEPEGQGAEQQEIQQPAPGLRFVVQHHMARREHYDFRLEWDGVMLSWAVPRGPSFNTRDKRLAIHVEDHPLEYRNFEGTIPKGQYGGGTVMIWDEGTWEPQADVEEGLRKGALKLVLRGMRLMGKWALIRIKSKDGKPETDWLLLKEKDEYAQDTDGIREFITSVRTGRTMAEIGVGQEHGGTHGGAHGGTHGGTHGEAHWEAPEIRANVQLAKEVKSVPDSGDWLYELKYDGYRILAYVGERSVRLMTRNSNDYTKRFPEVAASLLDWAAGRTMVLDGEMVVTDGKGRTDFQALQNHMKNPKGSALTYIVFDLLALDGTDLRGLPLTQRKETLEALMEGVPDNLYYSTSVKGDGKAFFMAACQGNHEGIIGKKADSIYSGTRNGDWIKIKCGIEHTFVLGGYTQSGKKARKISSLILGYYSGEELVYAGRAGTGLSVAATEELEEIFGGFVRRDPLFNTAPEAKSGEKIILLEAELAADIRFAEWTKENLLRQASYKRLNRDRDPGSITGESVGVLDTEDSEYNREADDGDTGKKKEAVMVADSKDLIIKGIRISSPDKVIYENPVITKLEVVRYYQQAAKRMLPYVSQRILSIVRCPRGASQTCFYKKHPDLKASSGVKGIVTVPVLSGEGEAKEYFYIDEVSGLIYEAQMGTLEFHTWGSRADEMEHPDVMVFDLDPDEGMDLETVRQGVRDLRSILDELSLKSYLKTSGRKGYHLVVPFRPVAGWEVFSNFAKSIAGVMEEKWPDRYTSNVRKAKRANKILIDWMRNSRGATSIAPYSLRAGSRSSAQPGSAVSMPVAWEELDIVAPDGITMAEALVRMEGKDPWRGFFQSRQALKQILV